MEGDVPSHEEKPPDARPRMPAPDLRPVDQMWDVHWSIVAQHVHCRERDQAKKQGDGQ